MESISPLKSNVIENSKKKKDSIQSDDINLINVDKVDNIKEKIEEITKQIYQLRKEREKINDEVKIKYSTIKSSKSPGKSKTKNSRHLRGNEVIYNHTKMHHPNLEFILAEVSLSPYMTDPNDKYPQTALKGVEKIREMRQKGLRYKDIPQEEIPFDLEKVRDTFVNEILKAQEFRKSEEFGRHPSPISTSAPGTLSRMNSITSKQTKPITSLSQESFPLSNNSNTITSNNSNEVKKPSKLRQQIIEARKSSSAPYHQKSSGENKRVNRSAQGVIPSPLVLISPNSPGPREDMITCSKKFVLKSKTPIITPRFLSPRGHLIYTTSSDETKATELESEVKIKVEDETNKVIDMKSDESTSKLSNMKPPKDKSIEIISNKMECISDHLALPAATVIMTTEAMVSSNSFLRPPLSKGASVSTVDYADDFHDVESISGNVLKSSESSLYESESFYNSVHQDDVNIKVPVVNTELHEDSCYSIDGDHEIIVTESEEEKSSTKKQNEISMMATVVTTTSPTTIAASTLFETLVHDVPTDPVVAVADAVDAAVTVNISTIVTDSDEGEGSKLEKKSSEPLVGVIVNRYNSSNTLDRLSNSGDMHLVEDTSESNDLALSRSLSISDDLPSMMQNNLLRFSASGKQLGLEKTNSILTKGVAEESHDEEFGDGSYNDDMTIVTLAWHNARNIRLQSISNMSSASQESSVEDFINPISTLSSAKSSRSSSKSHHTICDDLPSLEVIGGGGGGILYTPTMLENESMIFEDKRLLPFSPDANLDNHKNIDVPQLEIKIDQTKLSTPSLSSSTMSPTNNSSNSNESTFIEQAFFSYDQSQGISSRKNSTGSNKIASVVAVVSITPVSFPRKPFIKSVSRQISNSKLNMDDSNSNDEMLTDVKPPSSIEDSFASFDKMLGGSERRLSSTRSSISGKGETSIDYSNLPNYMKPTFSQTASPMDSTKNAKQPSFRSPSKMLSSSKLNQSPSAISATPAIAIVPSATTVAVDYISSLGSGPSSPPLSIRSSHMGDNSPGSLAYSPSTIGFSSSMANSVANSTTNSVANSTVTSAVNSPFKIKTNVGSSSIPSLSQSSSKVTTPIKLTSTTITIPSSSLGSPKRIEASISGSVKSPMISLLSSQAPSSISNGNSKRIIDTKFSPRVNTTTSVNSSGGSNSSSNSSNIVSDKTSPVQSNKSTLDTTIDTVMPSSTTPSSSLSPIKPPSQSPKKSVTMLSSSPLSSPNTKLSPGSISISSSSRLSPNNKAVVDKRANGNIVEFSPWVEKVSPSNKNKSPKSLRSLSQKALNMTTETVNASVNASTSINPSSINILNCVINSNPKIEQVEEVVGETIESNTTIHATTTITSIIIQTADSHKEDKLEEPAPHPNSMDQDKMVEFLSPRPIHSDEMESQYDHSPRSTYRSTYTSTYNSTNQSPIVSSKNTSNGIDSSDKSAKSNKERLHSTKIPTFVDNSAPTSSKYSDRSYYDETKDGIVMESSDYQSYAKGSMSKYSSYQNSEYDDDDDRSEYSREGRFSRQYSGQSYSNSDSNFPSTNNSQKLTGR